MRELCLVLDMTGNCRLTLKSGELSEIDKYTSKKFNDSEEIKQYYKKEIDDFLKENEENLKNSNNPNYKGRICMVLPEKVGHEITDYQRSILYKKHIIIFNELLNNRDAMCEFAYYEKNKKDKIVSDFICDIIRKPWNRRNSTSTHINEWLKTIKKQPDIYYQVIRDLLTSYENARKKKPYLRSIEQIYEDYIIKEKSKTPKKEDDIATQEEPEHEVEFFEEPIEYYRNGDVILTEDEFVLLDHEDIQDDFPFPHDALGRKK